MNTITKDHNAQPHSGINLANNAVKAVNMLYGIIMGITADQQITDDEIHFLNLWLLENKQYTSIFPLNIVMHRINDILADQIITSEEREDLYQTLVKITGGDYQETGLPGGFSTGYGAVEPKSININNSTFCLTGAFISGTREKCEQLITNKGGKPVKTITQKLNYLVVGALASRDWIAASHGRKIEKALEYQKEGHNLKIITEETLFKYINTD